MPGAIAGSLLLGLTESYGVALFGSSYRNLFSFALLLLILVVRPNGLFASARNAAPEPMTGTLVSPRARRARSSVGRGAADRGCRRRAADSRDPVCAPGADHAWLAAIWRSA